MVLVRIFVGANWHTARQDDDYSFDALPAVGHKLVIATDAGWDVAVVADIVHRLTDPDVAADIAILVTSPVSADDRGDPLPFAELDAASGTVSGDTNTLPAGPWGRPSARS